MQAIREIRTADSSSLTVRLPQEFLKRELEIIVLPVSEAKTNDKTNFEQFIANPIHVENFKMPSREERNAR